MTGNCSKCDGARCLVTEWRNVVLDKPMCALCANEHVRNLLKSGELSDPFFGPPKK